MKPERESDHTAREKLRVLLIEDDPDDEYLVRLSLDNAFGSSYDLEWARDRQAARRALARCAFDVCLLDYRLGNDSGLDLLREARRSHCDPPVIMLTANGDYDADVQAMRAGAADYLLKGEFSPRLLERSIRYAMERARAEEELREYRDNLEELVHERTMELEEAFRTLMGETSERRRAEEALKESEARHRQIVENALDIIYTVSVDGVITSINPAFETITGWPVSRWVGNSYVDLLHPGDLASVRRRFRQLARRRFIPPAEVRVRTPDGDYRTLELRTSARFEGDRIVGVHGVARDVTERKRYEDTLRSQNTFLNHVIESLTHPFYVLDANTYRVEMANSAARIDTPLDVGVPCYVVHGATEPCRGQDHVCTIRRVKETRAAVRVEHTHVDRQGNTRHFEVHGYPIFDGNGEISQIIEYSLDITDRRRMEEELRQHAEKTKLFAYSVSHDLKSPLTGIVGLTRLLHKKYAHTLDAHGRTYCEQILKASEHALMLVEEINAYVRSKELPLHFERIRPAEILKIVRTEFAALLGMKQVAWKQPDALPELVADRTSLLRIFRNLVDNAFKYGGKSLSRIVIRCRETDTHVVFSVSDDGVGLTSTDCETVFELFERKATSRGSEGTGLGLAIVKELAAKHGGQVWAEPAPEGGASFHFSIARALAEDAAVKDE